MISIESIESRASKLIERVLSNRDPEHHRLVFLQWATSLEILLFDEGGEKGAGGCSTCARSHTARARKDARGVAGSSRQAAYPGAVRSVAAL